MKSTVSFSILFVLELFLVGETREDGIKPEIVLGWAGRLGTELWTLGDYVTRRADVIKSFKDAKVEKREPSILLNELARDLENMMGHKIQAIKRVVETAENAAQDSKPEEIIGDEFQYYNAIKLKPPGTLNINDPNGTRELLLTPNSHFFGIPVNTSVSVVHVPTNVYDRATQWSMEPVDLYDCRMRSWYIEAATSPKDILILVDNSGSMMGQRKEIARHVVNSILDTLGNNDFVNIMTFVNETREIVDCYKDMLVQANLENIRQLKNGMKEMGGATYIANFSTALITAFDILQTYRESNLGASCNQAIMLVTDGVPYNFKEIFEKYNWNNLPFMPVRVFTYLLGKEVADVREVKWMACANRGYYVHLSTLAEVREQVLQYVPVMARPLVLTRNQHPIIWTPVYADITDPSMTDWLWEQEECKEQKYRSMNFRKDRQKFMDADEMDKRNLRKLRRIQDQTAGDTDKYRFMISVSMPVFDRSDTANITERVLINEAFWVQRTREQVKIGKDCTIQDPTCEEPQEMKVAFLLGVAGTDVPIKEINQILKPHWLGVNAYAFIVNNNGHILVHPDLRPVFQGILKPSYNSVDMTDVELMDDGREPQDFNEDLLRLRRELVSGNYTDTKKLPMKQHFDNMKRVTRGEREYSYRPLAQSPFTLVVSLPYPHGRHHVEAIVETHLLKSSKGKLNFFEGKNWKVHPDWFYCKYRIDSEETQTFSNPEDEVKHFFQKTQWAGWNWPTRYQNDIQSNSSAASKSDKVPNKNKPYFCDRNLFLSLVFDAKVTSWFTKNVSAASAEEKGKEFKQRFGLALVFLATRSGLTRWQDFPDSMGGENTSNSPHFKDIHNKAINEVWYRRAVEQNYDDPERFVYSVPFDSSVLGSEVEEEKGDILVTASNAIFVENGNVKAPAAVVGFQFQHSALHSLFMNITSSCPTDIGDTCKEHLTCKSEDLECYVLDSNAYIILSEKKEHTGFFFGEVRGFVMERLVAMNVYRRVHIYDYQGVCFIGEKTDSSHSNSLKNPLHYISWFGNWVLANVIWFFAEFNLQWIGTLASPFTNDDEGVVIDQLSTEPEEGEGGGDGESIMAEEEDEEGEDDIETTMGPSENNIKDVFGKVMINRTRPAPCTMEVDLYQLVPERERQEQDSPHNKQCDPPFVVQSIHRSDMILVVVEATCPQASDPSAHHMNVIPSEVYYNGTTLNCQKIRFKHKMTRTRPTSCIKEHEKEEDIKLCGLGIKIDINNFLQITCYILIILLYL